MCGRYYFDIELEELKKIADSVEESLYGDYTTGEIYPGNSAPVLIRAGKDSQVAVAQWGLPKWDGKGIVINARSETAKDKPMFKNLMSDGRCVILASSFFEWRRTSSGSRTKDKYKFTPEGMPLFMAGLIKEYKEDQKQVSLFDRPKSKLRFTILTKDADEVVSMIHSRMPLLLDRDGVLAWLSGTSLVSVMGRQAVKLRAEEAI